MRNRRGHLRGPQTLRRRLARPAIYDNFEGQFLTLLQGAHACPLNRADMDKYVLAAIIRLNKAETLGC